MFKGRTFTTLTPTGEPRVYQRLRQKQGNSADLYEHGHDMLELVLAITLALALSAVVLVALVRTRPQAFLPVVKVALRSKYLRQRMTANLFDRIADDPDILEELHGKDGEKLGRALQSAPAQDRKAILMAALQRSHDNASVSLDDLKSVQSQRSQQQAKAKKKARAKRKASKRQRASNKNKRR